MEFSGIKVNLQGFDERSIEHFRAFFKNQCQGHYQLTQQKMLSDIAVIDMDCLPMSGANHASFINDFRAKSAKKPLVVISNHGYENSDPLIFSLKKPLVDSSFYQLLQQITLVTSKNTSPVEELRDALLKHIQSNVKAKDNSADQIKRVNYSLNELSRTEKVRLSSLIGRHSDINIENPQAVMRILFDPKKLLLGSIKRGISRAQHGKKMIELTNFGNRFVIDPKTESIFTFVSESVIRPLCLISTDEISDIKTIKKGRQDQRFKALTEDSSAEVTEWSWDAFLWKIGLWTARGKLPNDTDLRLPVSLSRWPNFSRLQIFPHALSIAAIMSKSPIKLTEVAIRLGIEQKYVFAFYSAANAVGIAQNSKRQSDHLFSNQAGLINHEKAKATQIEAGEPHSIMQKMFSFLTKNNSDECHSQQQGVQK